MRKLLKATAVLFFVVAATVSAQAQKFGHIDMQALVQIMPERAAAEADYNAFQKELEDIFGEMQADLNSKMQEFEQMGEDVSEIKRNAKVAEIQDVQQRIQSYSANAQQQMAQKQNELMAPVFQKAQNAIQEVAKDQSLLYVFEATQLLYKSNESVDILPLVKTKLGL